MLLHIPGVLNREELEAVVRTLHQSEFIDGRRTAGSAAKNVKNNMELDRSAPQKDTLAQIVMTGLYRSDAFRNGAMPLKVSTPIFSRYTAGMAYGTHIDDPVMGGGPYYRTDVSFTVFLSDPESYEGGELTVITPFGEQQVKLPAGDAVVYPSGTLHRVAEVTAGERLVALGWLQSQVRDPAQRELLYNLNRARDRLLAERPEDEASHWVDHAYINLVRMWSDV